MKVQCPACDAELRIPEISALPGLAFRCPGCSKVSVPNHYEILAVPSDAGLDSIKDAYRRLALLYHPDRDPSGAERMKSLNAAFSDLSDATKRRTYDKELAGEQENARQARKAQLDSEARAREVRQEQPSPSIRERPKEAHGAQARGVPSPSSLRPGSLRMPTVLNAAMLDRLRVLRGTTAPGDTLAVGGLVILIVLPLFACCCGPSAIAIGAGDSQKANPVAMLAVLALVLFPLVCWAVGFPALHLLRKKLNADHERVNRLRLRYGLEGEQLEIYRDFIRSLDQLARLHLWKITGGRAAHFKYNAGATTAWDRSRASWDKGLPKYLSCNLKVYGLQAGATQIYFLPDCLLIYSGREVYTESYSSLEVEVAGMAFREDSKPPTDARIVGHSWKYTNVDGSPDRRFRSNYQVPICDYGVLTVKVGYDEVRLMTSSRAPLPSIAAALRHWGAGCQ